jgi:pimeloyl-ACP methyl ester carboxylesterase
MNTASPAPSARRRGYRRPAGHTLQAPLAAATEFAVAAPDPARQPWPAEEVNFTDLADLLSPWLDGQAIDLPGFGRSGPPAGGDYSIAAHTRLVIGYLERSGRGPVHLVGNSMGGAIAIQLAARRPDLVRTLTLISPAVPDLRLRRGSDALLPLLLVPGIGARLLARLENEPPERRARALIQLCFAHPERVPPNRLAEAVAEVAARREYAWAGEALMKSFRGLVRSYLMTGQRSAWQALGRIEAPSLVIWGELDRLVNVSNAARVAAMLPHGRLLVLPDIGHTAQLEDPITTRANDGRTGADVAG